MARAQPRAPPWKASEAVLTSQGGAPQPAHPPPPGERLSAAIRGGLPQAGRRHAQGPRARLPRPRDARATPQAILACDSTLACCYILPKGLRSGRLVGRLVRHKDEVGEHWAAADEADLKVGGVEVAVHKQLRPSEMKGYNVLHSSSLHSALV